MLTYLRRLVEERTALTELAQRMTDTATGEDRDLTQSEREQLGAWQTRCAELDAQIEEHNAQAESSRAFAALSARLADNDNDGERDRGRANINVRNVRDTEPSWGERVADSGVFNSYTGHGTSERIELPFETRAVITTDLYPLQPQIWAGPADPTWPTPFLDVMGHERVSTGSVEYIEWTPQPPGAAILVAEGELKPEMALTATPRASSLNTYAHYKAITRQALEDIPRIQSIVEGRLRAGLSRALETASAAALGTAAGIPTAEGDDLLSAIRVGIATVQGNGYTPNAVVLNPADWAGIDLAVMGSTLNGPVTNNGAFGLRFVSAPSVPVGTAYVGDFATAMTLFDRGVANVFMTDSHADFFLRNQLVILAETRALPVVVEPTALAEASVTTP